MSHAIKHLFHVDASPEKVFKAISTHHGLKNWWTIQTEGGENLDEIIQFRFGENGGSDMKIVELTPDKKIEWECVYSDHGWIGHKLTFQLDENDGKTRVRFSHIGQQQDEDFYAVCTFAWGRYFESLRQLCQTGTGQAFGTEGYIQ